MKKNWKVQQILKIAHAIKVTLRYFGLIVKMKNVFKRTYWSSIFHKITEMYD